MAVKKSAVVGAVRSPMNPRQWCLGLACGHDVWWTARGRRPKELECTVCTFAEWVAESGDPPVSVEDVAGQLVPKESP